MKEIAAACKEYKIISTERFSVIAIRQTLKVVKCYWAYQPHIEYEYQHQVHHKSQSCK